MSCPPEKEYNPFTKKCIQKCTADKVRIADIDKQSFRCYKRCKSGYRRNSSTLRCIKEKASRRQTVITRPPARDRPCKSGETRIYNPKLGVYKCYKSCKPGYHRSATTLRCIKSNRAANQSATAVARAIDRPCKSGETRIYNPKLGVYKCYKSCKPGYHRSATTLRCNKSNKASPRQRQQVKHNKNTSPVPQLIQPSTSSRSSLRSSSRTTHRRSSLKQSKTPVNSSNSTISLSLSKSPAGVIGEGTYGCIHRPSLKCNDENITNYANKVSKTTTAKEAQSEFDEYKIITALDPAHKYHLGPPVICAPKKSKFNTNSIHKCNNRLFKDFPDGEELSLLVMKDGGVSIEDYTDTLLNEQPSHAIAEVRKILVSMKTILEGLALFLRENVVHHDLKPQNVVYNPTTHTSLFIDFGLMTDMKTMNRKSSSVHWSYPLESLLSKKEDFEEYIRKNQHKQVFVRMACEDIYARLQQDPMVDHTKPEYNYFNMRFGMQKLIKSIRNFAIDMMTNHDLQWFIRKYQQFYYNYLDNIQSDTDIHDEFKRLKNNNLRTFDIYGISLIFWKLIKVAYVAKQQRGSTIDFSFVKDLTMIARRMSHPDYNQRIQIDELIPLYDDFLGKHNVTL
jgi:serine/threonine protein kinase